MPMSQNYMEFVFCTTLHTSVLHTVANGLKMGFLLAALAGEDNAIGRVHLSVCLFPVLL